MSTQHMSTEFISGRSTWVHSVLCDWLSILYCSVMHLSFKWFLDRLLRYWLWPAWNRMEGNIWSTTCCMYFCTKKHLLPPEIQLFQLKPIFVCMRSFMYFMHTHTYIHAYIQIVMIVLGAAGCGICFLVAIFALSMYLLILCMHVKIRLYTCKNVWLYWCLLVFVFIIDVRECVWTNNAHTHTHTKHTHTKHTHTHTLSYFYRLVYLHQRNIINARKLESAQLLYIYKKLNTC